MSNNKEVEILLVEDNQDDLDMTLFALRQAKLANQIQILRDGEEALAYLFCHGAHAGRSISSEPKMILLDLKLPKVDGLEVLRAIKADPRTRHIPVVMLTSSREQCDVLESYRLGVNSYIVKPVDFDQFSVVVQQLGLYWMVLNQNHKG